MNIPKTVLKNKHKKRIFCKNIGELTFKRKTKQIKVNLQKIPKKYRKTPFLIPGTKSKKKNKKWI